MVKYRVACLMHSPCKKKPRRSASGVSSLGEEGTTRRRLRSTISVLGKKKSSQIEDQKKMCLWLVGFGVIFLLLLCASECLAAMILKPSPKSSTRAEFEKGTPCQKSRRLSHLFEECAESIAFKRWILSFLPHEVGMRQGRSGGQYGPQH